MAFTIIIWYYHASFQRNHDITITQRDIDQKVVLCLVRSLKFSCFSRRVWGACVGSFRTIPLLSLVLVVFCLCPPFAFNCHAEMTLSVVLRIRTHSDQSQQPLSSCQTRSTTAEQSGRSRTQIEAM